MRRFTAKTSGRSAIAKIEHPLISMRHLVIHFIRFGPYHLARLKSAREAFPTESWQVTGLEVSSTDRTYGWREEHTENGFKTTVFPGESYEEIDQRRLREGMIRALDSMKPDVVAIAGWGSVDARACLEWCRKNGARAVLMSETREADGVRVWWKEMLKGRIIRRYDAAVVGGRSHRDYLVKLGMKPSAIQMGYNVVDNAFFRGDGPALAGTELGCFLASNRFVDRKNLDRLIRAYHRHLEIHPGARILPLVLVGDGELRERLKQLCAELGLPVKEGVPWRTDPKDSEPAAPRVWFPGFVQIDGLPECYAHASWFVHPALEEPWGLVLNEAMAASLPVLSSSNVGAAEELVRDGENGWIFDPEDVDAMAGVLVRASEVAEPVRERMGEASHRILEKVAPTRAFGIGLRAAAGEST